MSVFADVVAAHSGPGFVERRWLVGAVHAALEAPGCRFVLLTGDAGAGKTTLLAGLAARHPEWARYFVGRAIRSSLTGSDPRAVARSIARQLGTLDDARGVVLIDALDEAPALFGWLAAGPDLPPEVRLVVSSRPHPGLAALRERAAGHLNEVLIDPRSRTVRQDFMSYLRSQAPDLPDDAVEVLAERAGGSFAYVTAYRRDRPTGPPPDGLAALYSDALTAIRDDIAALGPLEIRDPLPGEEPHCPAWEAVGEPILGVLAVARDSLTLDQLIRLSRVRVWRRDVATIVGRLRPHLELTGPRMRLFHASLGEAIVAFLGGGAARWHELIALSYRDAAPTWPALAWSTVDRYGLRHVAAHLAKCRRPVADAVVDLVSPGLRRALVTAFGREAGEREFAAVTDLAADHAVRELPPPQALPAALFLGAVGRDVLGTHPNIPPALAGVLARHGRLDDALARLAVLPPSSQRFHGVLAVLRNAPDERGDQLRELLVQAALAVPAKREDGAWTLRPRWTAIREAAVALAPLDLHRALRLCRMADEANPDPIYRAAGDAPRLSHSRATLLLDLATRESRVTRLPENAAKGAPADTGAPPTTPGEGSLATALEAAEAALSTEDEPGRLVCHARLAALWRPLDASRSNDHVETVRSMGVTVLVSGGTDARAAWLMACVDAAAAIEPADPDAARWLLDRFDGMVADELTRPAILAAAALWVRWGDVAHAEFLLAPLLEAEHESDTAFAGQIAEVAAVVATFDREVALRLADETFRRIQSGFGDDRSLRTVTGDARSARTPTGDDTSPTDERERSLHAMATAFAGFAPDQALAAARLLTGRDWTVEGSHDRATVLAELAAAALDSGREPDAKTLIEESLASVGTVSTVDQVAPLYDGWDRVLRTLLESAALLRLDGVLPLVDRIADGNERAGALAGVAAVSEPEMASRLRQTAIATLDVLAAPVHSPSGAQRRSAPPSPLTPRALLTAARSRWSEAMELLERSAHPLVERWGVDLIEGLDTAVARARAFGD